MTEEELKKIEEEANISDKYVFMREEIKARPINKRKLIRNTLVAASSALVFGLVACITFALLAPFVLDRISEKKPEDDTKTPPVFITLPEESAEDEMTPEDMLVTNPVPETEFDFSEFSIMEEDEIKALISEMKFSLADYQTLYLSMADVGKEAMKSLVRVTPFKKNVDWFDYEYENESNLSGLIIGSNGTELFIVTKYSPIRKSENIIVTFDNHTMAYAKLVSSDRTLDLCIISVSEEDIDETTRGYIKIAKLGSSASYKIVGAPIIAIGSPVSTYGSMSFGTITGNNDSIHVTDVNYKQLYTNIVGGTEATGVLIGINGDVLGIIDNTYSATDCANLISAIGITELKKVLELMMNRIEVPYLGIKGDDVPQSAIAEGAPRGVFVLSVEMDSTAMRAGIQSGDIITGMGNSSISKFSDFLAVLRSETSENTYTYSVMRKSQDTYKRIELEVTFK